MTSDRLPDLLRRARAEHRCAAGASDQALAAAAQRLGYEIPRGMREMLRAFDGADLFAEGDYPCRLLSSRELAPVTELLHQSGGPAGLVAVLDCDDNYLGVDFDPSSPTHGMVLFCDHETFPYELAGVCDSVEEMLRLALDSKGAEWIWPAAVAYGRDFGMSEGMD